MKENYRTIFSYGCDEIIINKSKFIGYAMPINTEEEALEFIEQIKTKHRDATHNVYAYVVGENSNIQRFSDDGEPSGTAGIPALEVIKKEELKNVVVVVTRYFGGIKLGGGGLIRAYTRGAKIGLESGKIVHMIVHRQLNITMDYHIYGKMENYLVSNGYLIDNVIFDEKVNIEIHIKVSELSEFKKNIIDIANGNIKIDELDDVHLPVLNGKILSTSGLNMAKEV
ncbi:YigZ family protein [Wansuia hejianensis]|uniref:YigZ family protein n=1 Tax=Wansuia hejianensis TaxID=2763667 RepID=A0A926EZV0_9FIRM|nr:YigZ family protein [Wansuia hejianensis]MBC8590736.1 YigZ family protein [Wansuia hejianensis]